MKSSTEIYQQRINQVIDYVNRNLEQSFSLDELAAVACFSPYYFHRIFVALTGESINFFRQGKCSQLGALRFGTLYPDKKAF